MGQSLFDPIFALVLRFCVVFALKKRPASRQNAVKKVIHTPARHELRFVQRAGGKPFFAKYRRFLLR
jgi:hypothetical protein